MLAIVALSTLSYQFFFHPLTLTLRYGVHCTPYVGVKEIVMSQLETVQAFRPIETFLPAHWTNSVVHAADGTPLHVARTGGDKPAVILLHGIQVSGLMWLRTAKALEHEFDLIMPDFRGHGRSGDVENGVSSDLLVNDIITMLDRLNIDNPFVVGHSMGADIAGHLAAEAELRGVVLVDPALVNLTAMMPPIGDELPAYMQPVLEAMATIREGSHAEKMEAGLKLLPPGATIPHEEDYVSFVEGHAGFDTRFFQHLSALGYLFEEPDTIARIGCPLLLQTARPMMAPEKVKRGLAAFTSNWQNGQHSHFEDSGHFIPAEQFDRFIAELRAFFAAN
jgi:N-formylmaleamate deformylase